MRRQLERFRAAHPEIAVELRATPDNADQRHQLYVQWLNAHVGEPDVLQLDVVWTAEFAAAGWIAALDRFRPPVDELLASAVAANRWNGALYALPWFVDVGMLYWRTDLMPAPPHTLDQLVAAAHDARTRHGLPFGLVWQGARYEGLVTVFVEYLGAFGGAILDDDGRVVVDAGRPCRPSPSCAMPFTATGSCRPPCSRGRKNSPASRSRTARRPSCATGRMRSRSWTTRSRPLPADSPWRRCRARPAAPPPPRSGARRWP